MSPSLLKPSRPTRRRPRPDTVLNELSRAANAGRPPEDLLSRGLDLLLAVTGLPAGIACVWTKGDAEPAVLATRGLRPAPARTLVCAFPLTIPADTFLFDLARLPVPASTRDILAAERIIRGVVVPLLCERGPTGALVGLSRGTGAFRAPRHVLQSISGQLGGAVGNARVRQSLQTANADLLRLLTFVKILAEPRSLEDTLTMVARAARSFARAVTVGIWLANATARRLHPIIMLEPSPGARGERRRSLAYGEDLVGWVAETGQPGYVLDAPSDPRLSDPDWARERGITSLYGLPLRFLDELVGILSVGTAKPLSSPHLSLLEAYSDHAALAIGQADLRRRLET